MMLKVLIYGYATGTFSSRRLAQKLHEDIAFRVLGGENFPAHRTLSEFRRRHLDDFESVFVQLVRIAREVGLVKLGTVAIDGSKVKANASKHKAMSYGRMQEEEKRLRKEIRALTRQARQIDAQEDRKYGEDRTRERSFPRNWRVAVSGWRRSRRRKLDWRSVNGRRTGRAVAMRMTTRRRARVDRSSAPSGSPRRRLRRTLPIPTAGS
jgi:hypothetical protein